MPQKKKKKKYIFESDDDDDDGEEYVEDPNLFWWEKPSVVYAKLLSSNDDTTTGFGGSETINSITTTIETTSPSSIIDGSKKVKMRAIGTIMSRTKKISNTTLTAVTKLYSAATAATATSLFVHGGDKGKTFNKKPQAMLVQQNYFIKPNLIKTKNNNKDGLKKKRNGRRRRKSYILDEDLPMDYIGPQVECSFNFPRVSAQLEKLMGTNVVRLTDRKYMQELQSRIQEDYVETLQKRISQREHDEGERQKHLILNGSYSPETCPPRLIIIHSIALAKEMERERNLIMEGKGEKCPHELEDHPVFIANQKTNEIIARRRKRMKTVRERNAEQLIKTGEKWEKERLIYDEQDRTKRLELRDRQRAAKAMEEEYTKSNQVRGMDLLRIKNRDYVECEMDLKRFLDDERNKMLKRSKDPILDPNSKDVAVIAALKKRNLQQGKQLRLSLDQNVEITTKPERQSGSGSSTHIELTTCPEEVPFEVVTNVSDLVDFPKALEKIDATESEMELSGIATESRKKDDPCDYDDSDIDSYIEVMTDEEHMQMLDNEVTEAISEGHMLTNDEFVKLHFEDPKIIQLKKTDNVNRMYELADEIIGGTPGSNTVAVANKKK